MTKKKLTDAEIEQRRSRFEWTADQIVISKNDKENTAVNTDQTEAEESPAPAPSADVARNKDEADDQDHKGK